MLKKLPILAVLALVATFLVSAPAEATSPGWITTCQYSHSLPDDPIVFPNAPGASHLHDFIGARTTDAFSTPTSLRAGGTTCLTSGDTSAYWVMAMYEDGVRRLPNATGKHSLFYYRCKNNPCSAVRPFPDGLRWIVGNGHASSPAENPGLANGRIIFKCGPGSTGDMDHPPTTCSNNIMTISLTSPSCWDGVHLDSPDHISHMAYPVSGRCPASHPVPVPRIESFFRYPTGNAIGTISFASGPWWTIHQDFFNAWVPASLASLVSKCINAGVVCPNNPVP